MHVNSNDPSTVTCSHRGYCEGTVYWTVRTCDRFGSGERRCGIPNGFAYNSVFGEFRGRIKDRSVVQSVRASSCASGRSLVRTAVRVRGGRPGTYTCVFSYAGVAVARSVDLTDDVSVTVENSLLYSIVSCGMDKRPAAASEITISSDCGTIVGGFYKNSYAISSNRRANYVCSVLRTGCDMKTVTHIYSNGTVARPTITSAVPEKDDQYAMCGAERWVSRIIYDNIYASLLMHISVLYFIFTIRRYINRTYAR